MSLRETCGSLHHFRLVLAHHWPEEEEVESNPLPSKGPSPPTLILSQEHWLRMLLSGTLLSELEFLRKQANRKFKITMRKVFLLHGEIKHLK